MYISVIVPVYNVQEYVRDCVESIINQEYKDIEVLLIDDGSTDKSGLICDEMMSADKRIRVYHKANGGLSDARNYGIQKATGEYLTFIDSDDFIFPGYFEVLKELVCNYKAEVSCVPAFVCSNRAQKPNSLNAKTNCISGIEAIANSLLMKDFGVSVCGKLFKASLFKNIEFPKGKLFEDLLTIPYVFEKCKKVAFTNIPLYFYYNRPGSITHTRITEKHLAILDDTITLIEYLDVHCPEVHAAAVSRFCINSINQLTDKLLINNEYYKYIGFIKRKCERYWLEGVKTPILPKSTKVQIAIISKSSVLYWLLFNQYKKIKYKL